MHYIPTLFSPFQTCSKCKERRKMTKSFSIQKFPKVLVLRILLRKWCTNFVFIYLLHIYLVYKYSCKLILNKFLGCGFFIHAVKE